METRKNCRILLIISFFFCIGIFKPSVAQVSPSSRKTERITKPAQSNAIPLLPSQPALTGYEPEPKMRSGYTRCQLVGNLVIDIKGQYPSYMGPHWQMVNNQHRLKIPTEKYYSQSSKPFEKSYIMALVTCEDKPALYIKGLDLAERIAFIDVPSMERILINEKPKTFRLTGFYRVEIDYDWGTSEPTPTYIAVRPDSVKKPSRSIYLGWDGFVTLSASKDAALSFGLDIYQFTNHRGVIQRRGNMVGEESHLTTVSLPNNISPETAFKMVKEDSISYVLQQARNKQQQKSIDSLKKLMPSRYPPYDCLPCFERWVTSGSHIEQTVEITPEREIINVDKVVETSTINIRNKCDHPITFVGIQQFRNEDKSTYFKLVSKTLGANEENIVSILKDIWMVDDIPVPVMISVIPYYLWVRGNAKPNIK